MEVKYWTVLLFYSLKMFCRAGNPDNLNMGSFEFQAGSNTCSLFDFAATGAQSSGIRMTWAQTGRKFRKFKCSPGTANRKGCCFCLHHSRRQTSNLNQAESSCGDQDVHAAMMGNMSTECIQQIKKKSRQTRCIPPWQCITVPSNRFLCSLHTL